MIYWTEEGEEKAAEWIPHIRPPRSVHKAAATFTAHGILPIMIGAAIGAGLAPATGAGVVCVWGFGVVASVVVVYIMARLALALEEWREGRRHV